MTAPAPYHFARPARTPRNAAIVIGVLFLLGFLRIAVNAAWGILALGLLLVLPAIWDMARDRVATLDLDGTALRWRSSGQSGTMPLGDIARVVLDTRLDLSVRLTLELRNGARLRLPSECVPPKDVIAATCEAHGLPVRRNAFALL